MGEIQWNHWICQFEQNSTQGLPNYPKIESTGLVVLKQQLCCCDVEMDIDLAMKVSGKHLILSC